MLILLANSGTLIRIYYVFTLCLLCLFDLVIPSMLKEILSQLSDLNYKVYLQRYVVFNGAELSLDSTRELIILAFDSTLCVRMYLCGWMGD